MMRFIALFGALLTTHTVHALYVTAGSSCASSCNYPNGTFWPDLVCSDTAFVSDSRGQLLQSCLNCESQSLYINGTKSDQYWYMYHMKYVQQYCLIDTTTPHIGAVLECATECAPLRSVLSTLWLSSNPFLPLYNYCTNDSNAFPTYAPNCAKCLQAQSGAVIIGNMVETMANACADKPLAVAGQLVKMTRNVFNSTVIPLASSASSTGTASPTTSPSNAATSTPQSSSGGLSAGAAAGIAIAVVAVLVAVGAAAIVLIRKKRRARSTTASGPSEQRFHGSNEKAAKGTTIYKEMPAEPSRSEMYSHQVVEADGRSVKSSAPIVELPASTRR